MPVRPRIAVPVPTAMDPEYNQRCGPDYADAIQLAGGEAIQIPLDLSVSRVVALAATCSGVVLPGSPADVDPARYGQSAIAQCAAADRARERMDIILLDDAYHHRKPILGICFGAQILNVWRGGTLIQDLMPMPVNHAAGPSVAVAHAAGIGPESGLYAMLASAGCMPLGAGSHPIGSGGKFPSISVNSSHHQAVGIPGSGLLVAARSTQDGVIEAVEGTNPDHFVLGVQWHPERNLFLGWESRALFHHFVSRVTESMAAS